MAGGITRGGEPWGARSAQRLAAGFWRLGFPSSLWVLAGRVMETSLCQSGSRRLGTTGVCRQLSRAGGKAGRSPASLQSLSGQGAGSPGLGLGPVLPSGGTAASVPASFAGIPPSLPAARRRGSVQARAGSGEARRLRAGTRRRRAEAAAGVGARELGGSGMGSNQGAHPRFPTALGPQGGLGGGWWMPGSRRFFMVSEGSINSLNIQPFQVGFVEN